MVQASTFAEMLMDERSGGALEIADRTARSARAAMLDALCCIAPGGIDGSAASLGHEERQQAGSDGTRDEGRAATRTGKSASSGAVNAQIRTGEDMDRRLLAAMSDGVTLLSGEGRIVMANEAAAMLFGTGDLVGRSWADLWTGAEGREAARRALSAVGGGGAGRFQAATSGIEGRAPAWWDVSLSPMPDAAGQVLAVARDITEMKANEARQALLMGELSHRIKNTLAMVQAVATQTLRNAVSLESASDALGSRLVALAQAHDVLMQGAWSSADLRGLVEGTVALHGDGEPDRFRVAGPQITLGSRPGLTLALMLHELGTNAVKYGALSSPAGHVAVSWEVVAADGADHLRFRWEEIGGPPVSPPTRVGFGSRMIERSLVHSFGGTVRLTYPPTGAVLVLEAALAAVVADAL